LYVEFILFRINRDQMTNVITRWHWWSNEK